MTVVVRVFCYLFGLQVFPYLINIIKRAYMSQSSALIKESKVLSIKKFTHHKLKGVLEVQPDTHRILENQTVESL